MKPRTVTILWSSGKLTTMKSVNALRIAIHWLRIRPDVLMVHVADQGLEPFIYLKEDVR